MPEVYDWEGTRRFTRSVFERLQPHLAATGGEKLLLDLGCGTGNLTELLWGKGWEVVGLDRALPMLRLFQAKTLAGGHSSYQVCADIRRFALGRKFRLATCFYDVINHLLSESELYACLECVRAHLEPGGRFIFDVTTLQTFEEMWDQTVDFIEVGDNTTIITSRFDESVGMAHARVVSFLGRGDGVYEKREEDVFQYCFDIKEIRRCLRELGFHIVQREPFNPFPEDGDEPLKDWWVVEWRG